MAGAVACKQAGNLRKNKEKNNLFQALLAFLLFFKDRFLQRLNSHRTCENYTV